MVVQQVKDSQKRLHSIALKRLRTNLESSMLPSPERKGSKIFYFRCRITYDLKISVVQRLYQNNKIGIKLECLRNLQLVQNLTFWQVNKKKLKKKNCCQKLTELLADPNLQGKCELQTNRDCQNTFKRFCRIFAIQVYKET